MTTETDNIRVDIYDYQFTIRKTGSGGRDASDTHRQTVVCLASPALQLPDFSLEPEGFFNRVSMPMGCMDIDFVENSEFSDKFRLSGDDETEYVNSLTKRCWSFSLCKKDFTYKPVWAYVSICAKVGVILSKFESSWMRPTSRMG